MMNRPVLLIAALLLLLPALAGAQAFKCHDPVTGKTLYTDHPCKDGKDSELVVPARTEEQIRQDEAAAAQAREDKLRREKMELERELAQLQAAQATQAAQAAAQAQQSLINSPACQSAREQASFLASSVSATEDQLYTARYNAALACGQPPPVVVVQPQVVRPQPPWGYGPGYRPGYSPGYGPGYGYGGSQSPPATSSGTATPGHGITFSPAAQPPPAQIQGRRSSSSTDSP